MLLDLQVFALRGFLYDRNYHVNRDSLHLYFRFSRFQCSSLSLGEDSVIHPVMLFRGDPPRR
jgi:hypothetical protein